MKKIVLTVAIAISSVMAFANSKKSSLVNTNNSLNPEVSLVDTLLTRTVENRTYSLNQELSCVIFYNISRLSITNENNRYIRIESWDGHVINEGHQSIDIELPWGTYYVYTSSKDVKSLYKAE